MCEGVSGTCKPGWMLVLVFFAMQIGAGAFCPRTLKKKLYAPVTQRRYQLSCPLRTKAIGRHGCVLVELAAFADAVSLSVHLSIHGRKS
jgi:hypothetical protein